MQEFMQLVNQNSPLLQVSYGEGGPTLLSFPTRKFFLPIDTAAVEKMGIISADRRKQLVPRMEWEVGKSAIEKKSLLILDILATNNWKRPVYFSSTVDSRDFMGLQPYFQLEGMAYRILPAKDPSYDPRGGDEGYVEQPLMYDKLMKTFAYRGLDNPNIFYDENHLRFPANYRDKFARLANSYLASGDKVRAKQVMDKCFAVMPDKSVPYDYYVPQFIPALVAVGDKARANEIMDTMTGRAERALAYYSTHNSSLFDQEYRTYLLALNSIGQAAEQIGDQQRASRAISLLQRYMPQR